MARLSQRGVMLALAGVYGATLTAQQAIVLAAANKYASLCDHHLDEILLAILCVGVPGVPAAPSVPTGVTCNSDAATKFNLNWVNGALPQTSVEVWMNENGMGYYLAATVGPTVATFNDGVGHGGGTNACGKVRACNGALCSSFSSECCINF